MCFSFVQYQNNLLLAAKALVFLERFVHQNSKDPVISNKLPATDKDGMHLPLRTSLINSRPFAVLKTDRYIIHIKAGTLLSIVTP